MSSWHIPLLHESWVLWECLFWSYMGHPVVIVSWLPLVHICVGLTLWLAVRFSPDHSIWIPVQVFTTHSVTHFSRGWYLIRSSFRYVFCEANWILIWCCLKLATGCVGSGASCMVFWCRPISNASCDWSWATCLNLQSNLQLVAVSVGLVCVCKKGQAAHQNCFFLSAPGSRIGERRSHRTMKSASPVSICLLLVWKHWKSLWQYSNCIR